MKIYNIYLYQNVELDKTGSVIEPELPDEVNQWFETGDDIMTKAFNKFLEEDVKELKDSENPIARFKLSTKGDVTTAKIFYLK